MFILYHYIIPKVFDPAMGGGASSPNNVSRTCQSVRFQQDDNLPLIRLILKNDLALFYFSKFLQSLNDSVDPNFTKIVSSTVYQKHLYTTPENSVATSVAAENESLLYPERQHSSLSVDLVGRIDDYLGVSENSFANKLASSDKYRIGVARLQAAVTDVRSQITMIYMLNFVPSFKVSSQYKEWVEKESSEPETKTCIDWTASTFECNRIIQNIVMHRDQMHAFCDTHRYVTLLTRVFENLPFGCFIVKLCTTSQSEWIARKTCSDFVLSANAAMITLIGLGKEDIVGKSCSLFLPKKAHQIWIDRENSRKCSSGSKCFAVSIACKGQFSTATNTIAHRVVVHDQQDSGVLVIGFVVDQTSPQFLDQTEIAAHIAAMVPQAVTLF
jgi:hypothetical protein